jgi:hypothetical protein
MILKMVTLQSKIIICKGIHLDKEHVNVLNYTENQMLSLCESKAVATASDYSFIRNRGTIQTGFSYSQCLQSNYMAFQNKDYDNKWFFAFIDDVQYIGENNTEISYTIDSFATWFHEVNIETCFVVREHVNDDTIGKNTVPENLDIGDLISDNSKYDEVFSDPNEYWLIIATNYNPR